LEGVLLLPLINQTKQLQQVLASVKRNCANDKSAGTLASKYRHGNDTIFYPNVLYLFDEIKRPSGVSSHFELFDALPVQEGRGARVERDCDASGISFS
jgi:hypothetical protein